jgi:hypothetical protein
MSFHLTYTACENGNLPVVWSNIIAKNPVAHFFNGDIVYSENAIKTGSSPLFDDWTDIIQTTAYMGIGAIITVGAAVNGVLPTGAATVTNGGSIFPTAASLSLTGLELVGSGGQYALGSATVSGGAITAFNVDYGGKGYSNGGSAQFTLKYPGADTGFMLRKFLQLSSENSWQDFLTYRTNGRCKFYVMPDDHGFTNNWDNSVSQVQGRVQYGKVSTQSDVLAVWDGMIAQWQVLLAAIADNTLGSPNGDAPPSMNSVAGAASHYPTWYANYDYGYNGEAGGSCIRVLMLDEISYKSPGNVDSASSQMLGPVQEAWFYAQCADAMARGFRHIVVISSKDLFNQDNTDGWFKYSTERNRILAKITSSGWPVIWMSGDRHQPHASMTRVDAGDTWDHICLCACPFGYPAAGLSPYPQNIWTSTDTSASVFGDIHVDTANQQTIMSICDTYSGDTLFSATIPWGARVPSSLSSGKNVTKLVSTPNPANINRVTKTAGTSPWTYSNQTKRPQALQILVGSGGTISAIAVSRDGFTTSDSMVVSATTAATQQVFLGPNDSIKITWATTAPVISVYQM